MSFHGKPNKPHWADILFELGFILSWLGGVVSCAWTSINMFILWTKYTGDESIWVIVLVGVVSIGAPAGTIFCLIRLYRTFVNFLVAIRTYFVEYTIWEIYSRENDENRGAERQLDSCESRNDNVKPHPHPNLPPSRGKGLFCHLDGNAIQPLHSIGLMSL